MKSLLRLRILANHRSSVPLRAFSSSAVSEDYFATLHLPRTFDIDEAQLKKSYRKLMGDYHPDRHGHRAKDDQNELEQKASVVTHAYETLKRPHTRATHLLELQGAGISESDSTKLVGMHFLMEVMEVRDAVEHTSADDVLKEILTENAAKIEQACQELHDAFEANDIEKAKEIAARLQYWNRVEETVREKIEHFE